MTHGDGGHTIPVVTLTSPSKGQSLLAKSRALSSTAPAGATPAPVVMVVAQHSTAAGMRSLLPQHTLLQAGGGVVMHSGKVVRPPAGSNLLPLISTLPLGAKAVNIANLPAGMTAVPITSLANVAGATGGQQTVTLFGPISAPGAAGAAVPLSGANIVNISGSKHLIYSPAPLQAQPGGKIVTNKSSTSLLASSTLTLSSSSSSSPVVSQILLAGPKSSPSPNSKLGQGSANKASPSLQPAPSAPSGNNLESLRALLVGKPVALNPAGRFPFPSSVATAASTPSSLLSSTPMLFQMVTTSGTSLVPISAQPLTLTTASSPQLKHLQQQQSLLKSSPSSPSPSLLAAATTTSSSKTLTNGSSSSLVKPHVPNGVSCLTPPKTPDNDSSMEVAAAATLSKVHSTKFLPPNLNSRYP